MDVLTHVFLPLTIAIVYRPDFFSRPWMYAIGLLGLFSDFDKFLGVPGLLHSLITILPLCLAIILIERYIRDTVEVSPLFVGLISSHLILDFIDGGPVPLLYPISRVGFGLGYPLQVTFGTGLIGVRFDGPLFQLVVGAPRSGFNTYGFINSFGVAAALLFVVVHHVLSAQDAH